jgi:hypothetical protein
LKSFTSEALASVCISAYSAQISSPASAFYICFAAALANTICVGGCNSIFETRYHIVKTDKKILDHQTGDIKKRLLFEPIPGWWNVFRHALPEMFLLMVQVPPGIKTWFSMPAYNGGEVIYSVRIFNCICFLRLYLFVRLLKNTSSLHAEDLSIVSDLRKTTDLEESKLLYIKSVVHQHTTTICFFCVMGGITIFA